MSTARVARAQAALQRLLDVTPDDWADTPALWKEAKRLTHELPSGLPPDLVSTFYAKLDELGAFPAYSGAMPAEYFEPYARYRTGRARAAMRADISEDLVSETAFLFACRSAAEMRSYEHLRFDSVERSAVVARFGLIDAHKRYVAIPNYKLDTFRPLASDPDVLEGARRTLANDWFLEACARVERGEETWPRFDLKLWAACKLVLRLAGEAALAPGPEPEPIG